MACKKHCHVWTAIRSTSYFNNFQYDGYRFEIAEFIIKQKLCPPISILFDWEFDSNFLKCFNFFVFPF